MSTSTPKRKTRPEGEEALQQPKMKQGKSDDSSFAVKSSTGLHFLTIPQEIRDVIYEYVYLPSTVTHEGKKYVAFPPRLTTVCRQLRAEVEDGVVHGRRIQEITASLREHFFDPVEMGPGKGAKWRNLIETPRSAEYACTNQQYSHVLVEVRASYIERPQHCKPDLRFSFPETLKVTGINQDGTLSPLIYWPRIGPTVATGPTVAPYSLMFWNGQRYASAPQRTYDDTLPGYFSTPSSSPYERDSRFMCHLLAEALARIEENVSHGQRRDVMALQEYAYRDFERSNPLRCALALALRALCDRANVPLDIEEMYATQRMLKLPLSRPQSQASWSNITARKDVVTQNQSQSYADYRMKWNLAKEDITKPRQEAYREFQRRWKRARGLL